jgi:glycosyltransferase involved in cell wall biosynthesis
LQARSEGLSYKLVIIGKKTNFRSVDNEIIQYTGDDTDAVEFTGFISDEKLKLLIAEAALLVQPSLYEGFGIPPLEAMSMGTPALISGIPVFKEVYGDFPVTFFHAGDTADLKEKLMGLLYDKYPERIQLPEYLIERYSYQKAASIILSELGERQN